MITGEAVLVIAAGLVAVVTAMNLSIWFLSRRSGLSRRDSTPIIYLTLWSLVLIRLPTLVTGRKSTYAAVIVLAVFVLAIFWMSGRLTRRSNTATAVSLGAFVLVGAVAAVRGAESGVWLNSRDAVVTALTYGALAVFGVYLFRSADDDQRSSRLTALAFSPAVFVATSLVLTLVAPHLPFSLNTGSAGNAQASLLNAIGISGAQRTFLVLSAGLNSMGAIAAAGLCAAIVVGWRVREMRATAFSAAAVCVLALLITDSRSALLFGVGVTLLLLVFRRLRGASGLALALPLAPAVVVLALGVLAGTQVSPALSRHGEDFATGTGRTDVWKSVWNNDLRHPNSEYVFGYGANGQISSGAYAGYSSVFTHESERSSSVANTTHDVYIQTILDQGYIGLIVLMAVSVIALVRLGHSAVPAAAGASGALLVLLLCGINEALPTYYFPECMALFLLLLTGDATAVLDEERSEVGRRLTPPFPGGVRQAAGTFGEVPR